MSGLENIRTRRDSTYLRLTSKPVDQSLLAVPTDADQRERFRQQVIRGAYRLVDRGGGAGYQPGKNVVHIFAVGATIPEAVSASHQLAGQGLFANVFNVTGAGPLYREFQDSRHAVLSGRAASSHLLDELVPMPERKAPVVTVVDGHPHGMAWIGAALNAPTFPLGVAGFGQSGTVPDLYREYKIDAASIFAACVKSLKP
jgi:pyruvate dehydrogenase E1 component